MKRLIFIVLTLNISILSSNAQHFGFDYNLRYLGNSFGVTYKLNLDKQSFGAGLRYFTGNYIHWNNASDEHFAPDKFVEHLGLNFEYQYKFTVTSKDFQPFVGVRFGYANMATNIGYYEYNSEFDYYEIYFRQYTDKSAIFDYLLQAGYDINLADKLKLFHIIEYGQSAKMPDFQPSKSLNMHIAHIAFDWLLSFRLGLSYRIH